MKVLFPGKVEGTADYGGNVKIMVSKSTGSQLNSGIFSLKPGERLVDDIHESDEVFYIVRGTLTVDSPGLDGINAREGEIVLIPAGQLHISSNKGDSEVEVFWCNIEK